MGDRPHRENKLLARDILEQEAAGTGAHRVADVLVEIECREHQDPGGGACSHQSTCGFHSVHVRHPDVQQHHIGLRARDFAQTGRTVGGLTDHLDAVLKVEDQPEAGADQLLVVAEQYPDLGLERQSRRPHPFHEMR